MGEVAGGHRGAFKLHITAIPEVAVVVNGDHVTVEGDLDGLVGGEPCSPTGEQVAGLGFEAVVGDQGGGDGVLLHCCILLVLGVIPFRWFNYSRTVPECQ